MGSASRPSCLYVRGTLALPGSFTDLRTGVFRELARVPPARSYCDESGPYMERMPLRKRVTRSRSLRNLSSRSDFTPVNSLFFAK